MIHRILAALVALTFGASAHAANYTASPSTFATVTTNAKAGDVITLTAGNYGEKTISRKSGLMIVSPDRGAIFNTLTISASTGIHMDGIQLAMAFKPGLTHADTPILKITESSDIELSNAKGKGAIATTGVQPTATTLDSTGNVIGLPSGHVVWTSHVNGLRIAHSDLSQGYRLIQALASSNVTIEDNDLHESRKSLIACSVKDGFRVRRNHLWKATPWGYSGNFDHADAIANWTWSSEGQNTKNELIEDNLFEARDGQNILGIYLMAHDGVNNYAHENAIIRRNVIISATYTGIYVERGISGAIEDNIVLMNPVKPASMQPWVKIAYQNGQTITGNRFPAISWTTAPSGWLTKIKAANINGATKAGEANAAIVAWMAKFRR